MLTIGSLETGGSEKQLTQLLLRLPRERFDPVLLTSSPSTGRTPLAQELSRAGVPIVSLMSPPGRTVVKPLSVLRRYCRAMRLIDPDLVYAWLDETAAVVAPICRWKGIPCLVARRNILGSELERRRPLLGMALREAEGLATLVTANSSAVAAACVRRGHDPGRIRIVPNGHERLVPLPSPPAPPVVFGYVAHFRNEKGHHRLIDVLERVPRGPWRVDLAGEGPLRQEIEGRIDAGNLREHVRLTGPVEDVRGFWRSRHVAMLLSDSEGSPNALLEGAFAGRPAIATAVGGTPEVVGKGGILVQPDDPAAAAAAMHVLIEDAPRREALGCEIWSHVVRTHSMSRMLGGHIEALEETHAFARPRQASAAPGIANGRSGV